MPAAKLPSERSAPTRRATVTLRDGRTIVADDARWRGWTLHMVGRLRVRGVHGERFYATRSFAVPRARVGRVDWHRNRGVA